MQELRYHQTTYAVPCGHCRGGFIGFDLCPICHGDGSVIINERKMPSRRAKIVSRILFVIFIAICAYAIATAR
jgi:hypothetical protein